MAGARPRNVAAVGTDFILCTGYLCVAVDFSGSFRKYRSRVHCGRGTAVFGHGWQQMADFVTAITVVINHSAGQPYREG